MASCDLKAVFIEAQDSQNQPQLIKAFYKIYKQTPYEEFWKQFVKLIKHPLVVFARESTVEKTIEFIANAVIYVSTKDSRNTKPCKKRKNTAEKNDEDEEEDDMHPFLLNFFEFLLDVHCAQERAIRFRVCQLITRLLQNLGEGAKIDDMLYDRIYQCMVERLRDKCPLVRVHAVLALTRLQDPTDASCPITKAYMILMARDPNAEVRHIVLTCIAPSTTSLSAVLERTRDVKDSVRRTVYTVFAEKIPLRALSIEQRIQILQDGLNDRSGSVRVACSNKLLQAWLCACEGNILELLARLDVESSVTTCEKMLTILFKNSGILDLVQKFDLINEKSLIDDEKLTCESAFYWRNLVHYVHGEGHNYEEQLDQIRPNCVEFCQYIKSFTEAMAAHSDVDKLLDMEFILRQLLHMFSYMDFSDEASRKTTEKLLHDLLVSENIGSTLVPYILPCLELVHADTDNLINRVAETISDIREPITTTEANLSGEARRNLDKKIAGIRVKLHELRDELSDSIEKQDFGKAAQLKIDISGLDAEYSLLLEESNPKMEEVRILKNDAFTVLKCLTIVCELLSKVNVRTLTPALQMLMENQVLPGMVNEVAELRNAAVKAIGLCCLLKKEAVMQHLPLLLQAAQVDTQQVRATALKSIFDLLHVFGLEAFTDDGILEGINGQDTGECDGDGVYEASEHRDVTVKSDKRTCSTARESLGDSSKQHWSRTSSKVIAILSAFLDNESAELRNIAAEGLAKLLLSGRVVSSKLLSHLLLLWYNPLVEDDKDLLQCLGVFFPLYAFSDSTNQQQVEEAFVPTLSTLLRAPSTSPLAEVNELNVATFLVELTNSQHLVANQKSKVQVQDNPFHDSIAVKLCNEVLSHPDSFNTRLWLRILTILSISPDNASLLKDLFTMCEDMAMIVTEKQCIKLLDKFRDSVSQKLDAVKQKSTVVMDIIQGIEQHCVINDECDGTALASGKVTAGIEDLNVEEFTKQGPVTRAESGVKKKTEQNSKTPAMSRSSQASRVKSAFTSASKRVDSSGLDDSVFATPAPLKGSRMATDIEETRVNLENLLIESSSRTPVRPGKTPKTPKRPLHSIQDPTFTG